MVKGKVSSKLSLHSAYCLLGLFFHSKEGHNTIALKYRGTSTRLHIITSQKTAIFKLFPQKYAAKCS
jgi:hypothetical protein